MHGYDKTKAAFAQAVAYHFIMKRRVSRQDWGIARGYQDPPRSIANTTVPRTTRATRTTRTTTSSRTATMSSSTRSSDADDGGGEPPGDPAPIGAEGRATGGASHDSGPWLTFIEEQRLHREMAQRARSRSRYMRDVRGMRGWSS